MGQSPRAAVGKYGRRKRLWRNARRTCRGANTPLVVWALRTVTRRLVRQPFARFFSLGALSNTDSTCSGSDCSKCSTTKLKEPPPPSLSQFARLFLAHHYIRPDVLLLDWPTHWWTHTLFCIKGPMREILSEDQNFKKSCSAVFCISGHCQFASN